MKETAQLSPSPSQMFRSVRPYLRKSRTALAGSITEETTGLGNRFAIYMPSGISEGEETKVLYHLHGAGVRWSWAKKDLAWIAEQQESAVVGGVSEPMVIVAISDPSKFSMWSDAKDGSNQMASALVDDVLPLIDARFGLNRRDQRFIQGFSMGGFGAASIGLRHQDLFSRIIVWDGAMHDWSTLTSVRPKIASNQFGDDEAYFDRWSPWSVASNVALSGTDIMVVSGLMEDYADRYTAHLTGLGADVLRRSENCLHDLECLERNAGVDAFRFLAGLPSTDGATAQGS